MDRRNSISDIEGPWKGDTPTGLLKRCKDSWDTPIKYLDDEMICTYLNQKIALPQILAEAKFRIKNEIFDDTEMFDGQMEEIVNRLEIS